MFPSYSTEVEIQIDFLQPLLVGQNLAWPVLSTRQRKAPAVLPQGVGSLSEACMLFFASQPGTVIWRLTAEGEERGCGEDHFIISLAKKDPAISHVLYSLPDPQEIAPCAQLS